MPTTTTTEEQRPQEPLITAARTAGVRDERVLDALRRVPRERFVPVESRARADMDVPIRIPHGQVTTQPSLVARMVEALRLRGDERVLEIGTGLGYQAAVLAQLCREVYTIERFADLAEWARRNLADAGIENVHVVAGDGTRGLAEHAPYDAIIIAAASRHVPTPLVTQLVEGGRLVQPISRGATDVVTAFRREGAALVVDHEVTPAYFVPLVSEARH